MRKLKWTVRIGVYISYAIPLFMAFQGIFNVPVPRYQAIAWGFSYWLIAVSCASIARNNQKLRRLVDQLRQQVYPMKADPQTIKVVPLRENKDN